MSKKQSSTKTLLIVLISLVIVSIVGFAIYMKTGFYFGEPQECTITPKNPDCFCSEGFIKIFQGPVAGSTCVPEPDLPAVSAPIETWEEAVAYTEWYLLGTDPSVDGVQCTGNWAYRNSASGPLPTGYQEDPSLILEIECAALGGLWSGQGLYRMIFRPSDGCILLSNCMQQYISEKGLVCQHENIDTDPNFTTCPLV